MTLQCPQASFVQRECGVLVQAQCVFRYSRGDRRIAVAVPTDPRPEPEERRDVKSAIREFAAKRILEVPIETRNNIPKR